MKLHRSLPIVFALGMAQSVFGAGINGGTLTPCVAGSLSSYIDGVNSGCALGVLVSTSWALDPGGIGGETGGATLLDSSQIMVDPLVSANGLGGTFTFSGGSGFSVGAGQTAQYFINYSYFIDPGPAMDDAQLLLGNDPGNTTITQFFCNDSSLINPGSNPSCSGGTGLAGPPPVQTLQVMTLSPNASIHFTNPATNNGAIETEILLDGTNGPTNFLTIASTLDVVQGPEPSAVFLALGGLAAVGVGRWYVTRR